MARDTDVHGWTVPEDGRDHGEWGYLLEQLFDDVDARVELRGAKSERPAAADVPTGTKFYVDSGDEQGAVYVEDGSDSWVKQPVDADGATFRDAVDVDGNPLVDAGSTVYDGAVRADVDNDAVTADANGTTFKGDADVGGNNVVDGGSTVYDGRVRADVGDSDDPVSEVHGESLQTEVSRTADEPSVNVKQFGAAGDGSTDDTQSIKDAISHAQSSGIVKDVYFPDATYVVSEQIDFSAVRLRGDATLLWTGSIDGAALTGDSLSEVVGLELDATNGDCSEGIRLGGGNVRAERVTVRNVTQPSGAGTNATGIAVFSGTDGVVKDCRVFGVDGSETSVATGIKCTGSGGSGGNRIEGCVVEDVTPAADGDGIKLSGGTKADRSNPDNKVLNCVIRNAAKSGVKVQLGAVDSLIRGCTVKSDATSGFVAAYRLQTGGVTLSDCHADVEFVDNALVTITTEPSDITVKGGTFRTASTDGVAEGFRITSGANGVRIDGSTVDLNNAGRRGLDLHDDGPQDIYVSATFTNIDGDGVYVRGSNTPVTNFIAEGCEIRNVTDNGFEVAGGTRVLIANSTVDSAGSAVNDNTGGTLNQSNIIT